VLRIRFASASASERGAGDEALVMEEAYWFGCWWWWCGLVGEGLWGM
jgi:hypothetical protein